MAAPVSPRATSAGSAQAAPKGVQDTTSAAWSRAASAACGPSLRLIADVASSGVTLLDTGEAVARHTRRVLERENLLSGRVGEGALEWHTSGNAALYAQIRERLLKA